MTIQRNWQHRVHKRKKNKNTTQYVLDTTIRKQTQRKTSTLLQTSGGKDEPKY